MRKKRHSFQLRMCKIYYNCYYFLLLFFSASNVILSNVCQWYITQYARESVKEHILSVVQNNLTSLYWFRFMPTILDLELVLKVSQIL